MGTQYEFDTVIMEFVLFFGSGEWTETMRIGGSESARTTLNGRSVSLRSMDEHTYR